MMCETVKLELGSDTKSDHHIKMTSKFSYLTIVIYFFSCGYLVCLNWNPDEDVIAV